MPTLLSSPTPTTPRPSVVADGDRSVDIPQLRLDPEQRSAGSADERQPMASSTVPEFDGRQTPVPSSSSRSQSRSASTGGSLAGQTDTTPDTSLSFGSSSHGGGEAKVSAGPSTPSEPFAATVGLGTLAGEEQLKASLSSRSDRLFVMIVAKEMEAFIRNVLDGQAPSAALSVAPGTPSTSLLAGPSFRLATAPTSKFQRMLVYKTAEWYGLKAVAGPDAMLFVGVLGSLPGKSPSLRLSELVAKPASPQQKFRIMQRSQDSPGGAHRNGVDGDGAKASARAKTLEEREAAYAAARERIYGTADPNAPVDTSVVARAGPGEQELRGRDRQAETEDIDDPVPRRPPMEAVFPSLYNRPMPQPQQVASQPVPPLGYPSVDPAYAYQAQMGPYAGGNPAFDPSARYLPHTATGYPGGQHYLPQTGYMDATVPMPYSAPPQIAYQPGRQPIGPGQVPSAYPSYSHAQQASMPMFAHQPYPSQPQQWAMYPPQGFVPQADPLPQPDMTHGGVLSPVPLRPQPYPHSSHSSSMSSKSFGSHQDLSRPHSRGSTTSVRSGTSSVRMGAMYPADLHPASGYRQQGMREHAYSSGSGTDLHGHERRTARAHSPSSVTTTSSRSSRPAKASSIVIAPPTSHPLPNRPDWAANNIQYHPSAAPAPGIASPSAADFPPLHRGATAAEPMQLERARARPAPHETVWKGAGGKALSQNGVSPQATVHQQLPPPSQHHSAQPVRPAVAPSALQSRPAPVAISTTTRPSTTEVPEQQDPDFPRRPPAGKSAGQLYDPSAPRSSSRIGAPAIPPSNSGAVASAPGAAAAHSAVGHAGMTPEDIIEAKLQAVSISMGVAIGPPAQKNANGAPSYAKIVRRD